MTDFDRTFQVASEEKLVELIRRARRQLVIVAPALGEAVAQAVSDRLDQGFEGATVILDVSGGISARVRDRGRARPVTRCI